MTVLTLPATTHIHLTTAGFTGRRGPAVRRQMDVLTFNGNFSARPCVTVSQQLSGLVHHPAVAAVKHDFTTTALQPFCFNGATVIHHRVQQHVLTPGRQEYLPVGG
ncbi:TPA: hypothetical protein G8N99_005304, partial [Salmonella enterica]|nr:hypothetical protein [Salmonella enterica]